MAQEERAAPTGGQADDTAEFKRSARRRLIGAMVLALAAAIVLPMAMDHEPAPPLRDIQVRIPSPDEGAPLKPASSSARPIEKAEIKPISRSESKEGEGAAPAPPKPAETQAAPPKPAEAKAVDAKPAQTKPPERPSAAASGEKWEVQLGAYAEPSRVALIQTKLKELGLPSFTESVDTPNGKRTRVRAGPFASQDEAEKARTRIRAVGVDGPAAKRP